MHFGKLMCYYFLCDLADTFYNLFAGDCQYFALCASYRAAFFAGNDDKLSSGRSCFCYLVPEQ